MRELDAITHTLLSHAAAVHDQPRATFARSLARLA